MSFNLNMCILNKNISQITIPKTDFYLREELELFEYPSKCSLPSQHFRHYCHRQFVTISSLSIRHRLIIAIIIDTAEKSMIVKWWWLQRQKFIVSWESSGAHRSASELVHSPSPVQILEHTQSPVLLQILVQKSCTFL